VLLLCDLEPDNREITALLSAACSSLRSRSAASIRSISTSDSTHADRDASLASAPIPAMTRVQPHSVTRGNWNKGVQRLGEPNGLGCIAARTKPRASISRRGLTRTTLWVVKIRITGQRIQRNWRHRHCDTHESKRKNKIRSDRLARATRHEYREHACLGYAQSGTNCSLNESPSKNSSRRASASG
jgi:hypothetical protein